MQCRTVLPQQRILFNAGFEMMKSRRLPSCADIFPHLLVLYSLHPFHSLLLLYFKWKCDRARLLPNRFIFAAPRPLLSRTSVRLSCGGCVFGAYSAPGCLIHYGRSSPLVSWERRNWCWAMVWMGEGGWRSSHKVANHEASSKALLLGGSQTLLETLLSYVLLLSSLRISPA